MTREEEIMKAARVYANGIAQHLPNKKYCEEDFIAGAEWADAHPHWISVDDELPKRFVLDPNDSVFVLTYGLRTIVAFYKYDKGEWVGNTEVTHWMPLPQLPTVAKNATVNEKGGER